MSTLRVERVTSKSSVIGCRRFLASDPIANILPLGDLYSPLLRVSDIYRAVENRRVVGVCSVYRAYSTPSLVFGAADDRVKRSLVMEALQGVTGEFVSICPAEDVSIFKECSTILHSHLEQQMIVNSPKHVTASTVKAQEVGEDDLASLNRFYEEHHAEAWTPVQFEAGPYYCVKDQGRMVSAAGVHLVAPQIAQLGNIITDEAYRSRGFATECTSALVEKLAVRGRIVSLFVRIENAPAIHMYEKLGFAKKREIVFLTARKNV